MDQLHSYCSLDRGGVSRGKWGDGGGSHKRVGLLGAEVSTDPLQGCVACLCRRSVRSAAVSGTKSGADTMQMRSLRRGASAPQRVGAAALRTARRHDVRTRTRWRWAARLLG